MTAATHDGARALLVVSKDYGELGFAISLLRGQEFATRARMLLPDDLYAPNKDALPVPVAPYATLDDITSAVAAHRPDLVFLLSGYLFPNDRLLSPELVHTLVRQLHDRGCRVVTSDPFLGLASRLTLSQVFKSMFAKRPLLSRLVIRLLLRLRQRRDPEILSVPNLDDVIHLYPTSVPDCGRDDRVTRVSFFNPTMVRPPKAASPESRPRWLFILSSADLFVQDALLGRRKFERLVTQLLQHTLDVGRCVTLIAPRAMVDVLSERFSQTIDLLPFCPFVEFEKRLLDAEYVFFWNAFSFSQMTRIANGLPFFLFNPGHVAHLAQWAADGAAIKPYYQVALNCHFGGWVPPYRDQSQRLDPRALAELGEQEKPAMRMVLERWASSQTPDELVDKLLHAKHPTG